MFDYTQVQVRLLDALKHQHVLYQEGLLEMRSVRHGEYIPRVDVTRYGTYKGKRVSAQRAMQTLLGTIVLREGIPGYQACKVLNPEQPSAANYLLRDSLDFWSTREDPPSAQNLFLRERAWFDLKNRPYEDRWKALNDIAYHRRQQVVRLKQEGKNRERLTADSPVVQAVLHAHSLGLTVNEITEHYEGGTRATIKRIVEKYG